MKGKRNSFIALTFCLLLCTACTQTGPAGQNTQTAQPGGQTEEKQETLPQAEEPWENYIFDLNNKEAAHYSSGTGGTENLYKEGQEEAYEGCFAYTTDDPIYGVEGVELRKRGVYYAQNLPDEKIQAEINAFLKRARYTLAYDPDFWEKGKCLGVRIYDSYTQWGEVASFRVVSYGENGEEGKTAAASFNLKTGKRLSLSDMFYDGFNYIDYINTAILAQIEKPDPEIGFTVEDWSQKRAFSGLAADYPYFYLGYGSLYVILPQKNPFFTYEMSFPVPMDKAISPYGGEKGVEVSYDMRPVSDWLTLPVPTLRLNRGEQIDERLNTRLLEWIDEKAKDEYLLKAARAWYDRMEFTGVYRLPCEYETFGHYLTVYYGESVFVGPTFFGEPPAAVISFDMETGQEADLRELIPAGFDWSQASIFRLIGPQEWEEAATSGEINQLEGYEVDPGAKAQRAWLRYGNLYVQLTEPSGKELIAAITREFLEKSGT